MNLAIIFDLDGTLIDTPRGIIETFTATLKSIGAKAQDASVIKATIGLPLEQAFSNLLLINRSDELVKQCVKKYQALFKEIVLPNAKQLIFPKVIESLTILKTQGYKLAVATSKVYASAEALLSAAGLMKYFDLVVGADHVTNPKPHPEMGELVMKKLEVLSNQAIMVGDTTHDILMAKACDMRSIAVTYGVHDIPKLKSAEPTWMVNTFDSVLNCAVILNEELKNSHLLCDIQQGVVSPAHQLEG